MTHMKRATPRLVVIALALVACGQEPATPSGRPMTDRARPLPVAVAHVHRVTSFTETRTCTGEVVARRTTELGFEVAGRIVALQVDAGDTVAAGAMMARLDPCRLEIRRQEISARRAEAAATLAEMRAGPRGEVIAAARAEVAAFEQEERLAALQLERQRGLLGEGVLSQDGIDIAETRRRTASARLDGARSRLAELEAGTRRERIEAQVALVDSLSARLRQVEVDLRDSTLRAPFAGKVAARHLDPGAVVAVGQPVLQLVEVGRLEAWIGVPPDVDATTACAGTACSATIEVGDHSFPVADRRVLPGLDPATRTATVVYDLPEAAGGVLRIGDVARLRLELRVDTEGFWLPVDALAESRRGMWSCYVLGAASGAGFAVLRAEVEVLHFTADRALVRGTLRDGDRVLTGGTERVVPGQVVVPMAPRE